MPARIYERIGGASSVSAAVDRFYEKIWADPRLADYFEGIDRARLKAHQRAFMLTTVGGPQVYNGREMREAHAGLGITDAAFDQVLTHLATTLTELGVDETIIDEITGALAPLRADIVEPIFTQPKEVRGMRRFLLRSRLRPSA
jgi:hemoglobin